MTELRLSTATAEVDLLRRLLDQNEKGLRLALDALAQAQTRAGLLRAALARVVSSRSGEFREIALRALDLDLTMIEKSP